MTSKIVVNNIESDAGVSTVFFNSDIGGTGGTLNVDGNLNVDVNLNVDGNLNVGGVLSYEDVTNIDSVGLVTARNGLHVTGGNTGIGTDNPTSALEIRTTTTNAATHYRNNASNGGAYFGVRATDLGAASAGEAYVYSYNTGINLLADGSGHIDFATGGTSSKVRITSNGKFGIDNTAPHRQLVVGDGGDISCFGENGGIYFGTSTGGFRNNGAIARAAQAGYHVSTSQVGDLVMAPEADKALIFSSGSTNTMYERLRVTTGGNIGIGENNPQNPLHITGSSTAIRFEDTGANGSAFSIIEDNDGLFKIRNDAGNSGTGSGIAFEVDAAERLRITSGGQVNIGNSFTQTTWLTHIEGAYNKAGLKVVSGAPGYSDPFVVSTSTGGERFRITGDGKASIGGITPQNFLNVNATGSMGLYGTIAGKVGHSIKFIRKYSSSSTHTFATINGASPHGQSRLGGFVATYTFRSAYGFDSDGGGHGVRMLSGRVRDSGEWGFDTETNYGTGDSPRPTLQGVDNSDGTCNLQVVNPSSTHSYGEFHIVAWDCVITSPST